MENTRFTAEFCAKTVLGFCRFSPDSLMALAADLQLALNQAGLLHIQKYFMTVAGREPTIGELRFLSALVARMGEMPSAITLQNVTFENADDARIFADIVRQREAMHKREPLTPAALLHTVTDYLARSGRTVQKSADAVQVGTCAELAARGNAACALHIGAVGAARLPVAQSYPRQAGDLVLALQPRTTHTIVEEATAFLTQFAAFSPIPFACIGEEGLGVHLGALPMGVELDLMPVAGFDASCGAPALINACQNMLLFTCQPDAALTMLREGAPLLLLGRLNANDLVTVRYGMMPLCSLNRSFLASMLAAKPMALTVPSTPYGTFTDEIFLTQAEDTILCGTALGTAPEGALSHLLLRACETGCDMKRATLATVLSLPLAATEATVATAISLTLPLHRFAAELALPTGHLRITTAPKGATPTLTVFLSAPKAETVPDTAHLKNALYQGDFATVRALIYPQTAKK